MYSKYIPVSVRRVVAARAGGRCEYCRTPESFATQSYSIDHIHPRQGGGQTILENLAWACFGCNSYKHSKTHGMDPETGVSTLLFNPRLQNWGDHFAWSEDGEQILGNSANGQATVNVLQLNRTGLINLRRILVITGFHPGQ